MPCSDRLGANVLERAHDRDECAFNLRKVLQHRGGINIEAEAGERLLRAPAFLTPGETPTWLRDVVADPQVFQHAHFGHEPQVLMHETQTEFAELAGRQWQLDLAAVDLEQSAGVRVVKPCKALDES